MHFKSTELQIQWCLRTISALCKQSWSTELFETRVEELKRHLLNRHYNLGVINKAKERISLVSRQEALKRVDRPKEDRKLFITEYHPSLPPMGQVLKKHWSVMVDRDRRLRDVFPQHSMVAYKRGQSLKDLLCRAKLPTASRRSARQASKHGFTNCGQFCVLCPFVKKSTSHTVADREFQINGVITCKTTGCVYKILCQQCVEFFYIGQTGKALRVRFSQHKGDIVNARNKPVAEHFNLPGHSLEDVIFIGIERVMPPGDRVLREQRESYYIRKTNAVQDGANRRF